MLKKFFKEHPTILLSITLFTLCTFLFAIKGNASQKIKVPTIVSPNGSGTDGAATDLTISAGRGTGSGTPGDIILQTSAAGSTGTTLQTATERLRIKGTGYVGIGTDSPSGLLDVNSDKIRIRTAKTPASATATGNAGEICWDPNHVYICIGTNTWVKAVTATW